MCAVNGAHKNNNKKTASRYRQRCCSPTETMLLPPLSFHVPNALVRRHYILYCVTLLSPLPVMKTMTDGDLLLSLSFDFYSTAALIWWKEDIFRTLFIISFLKTWEKYNDKLQKILHKNDCSNCINSMYNCTSNRNFVWGKTRQKSISIDWLN